MHWFERITASETIGALLARGAGEGSAVTVGPLPGSAATVVAAALAHRSAQPLLLVTAHRDEAEEALETMRSLGLEAALLPGVDGPGAIEQSVERLLLLKRIVDGSAPQVIVSSIAALMQRLPPRDELDRVVQVISRAQRRAPADLLAWLLRAGYEGAPVAETPGQFVRRGGVVDVFPFAAAGAVRMEYFGDEIERLFEIDPATQASDRSVESVVLVAGGGENALSASGDALTSQLAPGTLAFIADLHEVAEQGRAFLDRSMDARAIDDLATALKTIKKGCRASFHGDSISSTFDIRLGISPLEPFPEDRRAAFVEVGIRARSADVVLLCDTPGERLRADELLREVVPESEIVLEDRHLHRGFCWESGPGRQLQLVPQHEVLHRWGVRRRAAGPTTQRSREAFLHFEPGDFVVHRDHGIARYGGLRQLEGAEEYLELEYAAGGRLHVPLSKVALVQRYIGAGAAKPQLSTLGSLRWRGQRESVQEAVRDMAAELLRVQAARDSTSGFAFPPDGDWQREFEADFPFEETPDQSVAIAATRRDMEMPRPMDRLLCGDVGFGKTEVALRAAFKAVASGKQVAVLVPTTVLAEQHGRTFSARFKAYPFRVEMISRFRPPDQIREVVKGLAAGEVDLIIGTHRLLSKDIAFKDLGLVIVDEEQRFGVEHKQRLLEMRLTADVLTLSATPIPRTLHMAMLGLRDISSLATAPPDRRAIVTEVVPFDQGRMAAAIKRELAREGQVFWVHNRVHDIHDAADRVARLAPGARIVVGHGQMADDELEQAMSQFIRGDADILVSTTIIESGLDIPTANTMIVENASHFGLSELHQLRGRIGRSSHRAYCYLLLGEGRPITADGLKRLRAIEDYSMLGAGFRIAVRDLEIRGAGNLLGAEQSGHIAAVGYEMYCQLLEEAVGYLRHEERLQPLDTVVAIGLTGHLPKEFIPSERRRIEASRRIGSAADLSALENVRTDLQTAYGELPAALGALFVLTQLRLVATVRGISSIAVREKDIVVRTSEAAAVLKSMTGVPGGAQLVGAPDKDGNQEIYWRPPVKLMVPAALAATLLAKLSPAPSAASGR